MNERVLPISPSASVDPRGIRSRAGARVPFAYAAESPYMVFTVTGQLLMPSATARGYVELRYRAGAHDQPLEDKFERLAEQWRADTGHLSVDTDMTSHPAYLRIIGMGTPALPLILEDLERTGDFWFTALEAITGEDPVPWESRGKIKQAVNAWLDWGRQHGLL